MCNSTYFVAQNTQIDTTATSSTSKKNSFTSIFYGQPGKAALYSLILPSAGQIYNKRYWKVPFILAIEGGAIWYLDNRISAFQNRDRCWQSFLVNSAEPDAICGTLGLSDINSAFNSRQSARSQKDLAWVFMGLAHLFNVIEAFVDRHLINFDTSEDLTIQIGKMDCIKTRLFNYLQSTYFPLLSLFIRNNIWQIIPKLD